LCYDDADLRHIGGTHITVDHAHRLHSAFVTPRDEIR